jgi:MraZ protein
MAYFSGEYECTIDAKGRMILPAKLKVRLPETGNGELHILKSTDPCLWIYAPEEWNKLIERVSSLNEFDENATIIQRNLLRNSTDTELDAQGRFLISKRMLEYAGITKEAILVGLGNRLELWNPEIYDQYLIKDNQALAGLYKIHLGSKS